MAWWTGVLFTKKRLAADPGTGLLELKEIAPVSHSHFLEGRIEKWRSSYSP